MLDRIETGTMARGAIAALLVTIVGCAPSKPAHDHGAIRAAIMQRAADEGEPRPFNAPDDRGQFDMDQRLGAGMTEYPTEHMLAVRDEIKFRGAAREGGAPSWHELGPGNVGGRTRALVINPVDTDIMYAGGVAGGIWKTTDAGASWHPLDEDMLSLAIGALAIDPTNPDVVYAGTGEGYGNGIFVKGAGIFKTTDAGESWTQLPATNNDAFDYTQRLQISHNDPNRIYAATRHGVYRSFDAGATWNVVLANPLYTSGPNTTSGCTLGCTDVKIQPGSNPERLFACFGVNQQDGLYRSTDGGDTWVQYGVPSNQGRMTFAFAPSNPDVAYILMADNGSGAARGQLVQVFRSLDAGDTWAARVSLDTEFGPWLLSNIVLATGCIPGGTYSQGWYDNTIAVDPSDPDTVWVGGVDLLRSDDGGATWGLAAYWFYYQELPPPPYQVHPDHHDLVFHPDYDGTTNQTLFVTNDGGLFRTDNARADTTQEDCPFPGTDPPPDIAWERLNNGYAVTQYYHGDSAIQTDVFVGGSQDNGSSRGQSASTPDEWDIIFGGDGGYVAIDPTNPDTMYVEYQFFPNIQKSIDGGETFVPANNGITDTDGVFIVPFAMDQNDPDVLWTGGSRPWRTTNGADLWTVAGPNWSGPNFISAIAIAPSDSNVVYMGFNNGYVVRTTNGLSTDPTWTIFVNGLYGAWVSSIAVDHNDPDVAYLTYSTFGIPHVLRTIDGGQNWAPIDGAGGTGIPDLPAHWVAVRPCNSSELYVGTEIGTFRSTNGGSTWAPFNADLPLTVIESLDFRGPNRLVAYTFGRGAHQIHLPACCAGDVTGDGAVDVSDLLDVLDGWGATPDCISGAGPFNSADTNYDCVVDVTDLLEVLEGWGGCDG